MMRVRCSFLSDFGTLILFLLDGLLQDHVIGVVPIGSILHKLSLKGGAILFSQVYALHDV